MTPGWDHLARVVDAPLVTITPRARSGGSSAAMIERTVATAAEVAADARTRPVRISASSC